ncbi:MAG: hypothetical protein LBQ69_00700 [Treponema sp.]|jgi:hypothetical protein|nr:hypothetical protein [Treponema sp.]
MRKALALLLLLGLYCFSGQGALFLYAQEEDEDEEPPYDGGIPIESDWDGYIPDLYSRGDQTFTISLGVVFPTVFFNNGKEIPHNFSPPVGGTGSLAYSRFLNAHFSFGAEVAGIFFGTLAKNTVFLVPIGARAGWQFVIRRFEFPLYAVAGVAIHRYLNSGYVGLFVKGVTGAFFRFNPDWSFGINFDWGWYPEWPLEDGKRDRSRDVDGNIIGLTLSARYHF